MTLFGNRRTFGIEIQPVIPSWERRYLPERAAWAGLSLWVGGANLCAHVMPGSDRIEHQVHVPLASIADWFVRTWPYATCEERARVFSTTTDVFEDLREWLDTRAPAGIDEDEWIDLREEWWSRHCLQAGADGAFLPNVGWVRQDDVLVVSWREARFAGEPAPVFVAIPGQARLSWGEVDGAVREFVAAVGADLRSAGLGRLYPWVESHDPLGAPAVAWIDRVAAYVGRTRQELAEAAHSDDPKAIARWLGLPPGANDPAASPVAQVLSDLPPRVDWSALAPLLERLQMPSSASAPPTDRLTELRARAADAARGSESVEEAGYRAARAVRSVLGLGDDPVRDTDALLSGSVGVELAAPGIEVAGARMMVARDITGWATTILLDTERTRTPWGRRFETARALGHLVTDPLREGALGAASSSFARTLRRRRSGAFAAEFLLPEAALASASGGVVDGCADVETFQGLLERYGVGARTAAQQLWNQGWLSSKEIRDDLIDAFARPDPVAAGPASASGCTTTK